MSILIKGVEMPTGNDELRLIIRSNGQVIISHKTEYEEAEAVPVPPHGRLIDADELAATCDEPHWCAWLSDIDEAPTIIPAEPQKDDAPAGPYDLLYEEGGPDTR